MDLNTDGPAPITPSDEAPPTPPPSLSLSGDDTSAIPDHTLGATGCLKVYYTVRSASQPSDGQDGDKSISLDLTKIEPDDSGGDETPAPGADEGGEKDAEAAEGDISNNEGDDGGEEKALGFKRPKKKSGPNISGVAKALGDY